MTVLATLAIIALITPIFQDKDLGLFKTPKLSSKEQKFMKILGPIMSMVVAVSFLPLWNQGMRVEPVLAKLESSNVAVRLSALQDLGSFRDTDQRAFTSALQKLPALVRTWASASKAKKDPYESRLEGCRQAKDPVQCLDDIADRAEAHFADDRSDVIQALKLILKKNVDAGYKGSMRPEEALLTSRIAFSRATRSLIDLNYSNPDDGYPMDLIRPQILVDEPPLERDILLANISLDGLGTQPPMDFSGVDLTKAVLRGNRINGSIFSQANLQEANLSYSYIFKGVFTNVSAVKARLISVDLGKASLVAGWFPGADFRGSNFWKADISSACFYKADFRDFTTMRYCNAQGACFFGANFDGAHIGRREDVSRIRKGGADREKMKDKYRRLVFESKQVFTEADFRGADLRHASMNNVYWWNIDLRGADMSGATGLSEDQLAYSVIDSQTKLPKNISQRFAERLRGICDSKIISMGDDGS